MRIIWAGCSLTYGDELKNREEERFSHLVSDQLGAEEVNLSRNGNSNDIILNWFIRECNRQKPDVAVIQWSQISRFQLWNKNKDEWENLNIIGPSGKGWPRTTFYKVYTDEIGIEIFYKNVYLAEQYCKSMDIPLFMLMHKPFISIKSDYQSPYKQLITKMPHPIWDGILPGWDVADEFKCPNGHPNELGHRKIAEYIINNFDYFQ